MTLASRVVPHETPRGNLARELLDQAREDYRRKQYLACLDRCETLIANYAESPEGAEASKMAAEIKANQVHLRAEILSEDGQDRVADEARFKPGDEAAAEALAKKMLAEAPDSIRRLFAAA